MKYIGENAIKKLISLIKGDLATKQDSIAATGVLERDTTGVINGVETVGATLVETQEAKLVDVPNGLLKGDGTTISAAVAGTDYVNSSQAIRYDAAQPLTDAQKTQARENIAAAPDGYGLGKTLGMFITDGNEAVYGGNYYWGDVTQNLPFSYGFMGVTVRSGGSLIQTAYSEAYLGCSAQRKCTDGTFGEWEYLNPPMELGKEYRTTERYLGKPVYAQIINCGSMPDIGSVKNTSIAAFNVGVVTFISGWCTYYGSVIDPNLLGMALSANTQSISIENIKREVYSNAVMYTLVKYTKNTD